MKTLDKYLIKQFIGPFIVTFFIAQFVFLMQFIWLYVDEMVGKGAGFGIVMEIIFYNSISIIPMSLPVAILISSVMVMGNLSERYELASLKSAGVSLIRVMRPLLYFCIGISILSFFFSNNVIPYSNLKFKSRLHDLRKAKPTLNLEENVFNEDFKGFIIHIGNKLDDNKTIEDVIIYDHKNYKNGKLSMITAKTGEMLTTDDDSYFIMNLKDGFLYQEGEEKRGTKDKTYPFIRTEFKEWQKVFDLSEFDIDPIDEDLIKKHYTFLSIRQLWNAVDSIDGRINRYHVRLDDYVKKSFHTLKDEVIQRQKKENAAKKAKLDSKKINQSPKKEKSVEPKKELKDQPKKENTTTKITPPKPKTKVPKKNRTVTPKENSKKKTEDKKNSQVKSGRVVNQVLEKDIDQYANFLETIPEYERNRLKDRAKVTARGILTQAQSMKRSINPKRESRVKHLFQLHSKLTMALICCVFLFIGAPMGAIVRKGGFGYPILIAIIFFVTYMVFNLMFERLAKGFVIPGDIAAWCTFFIFLPVGYILTKRAMEDKKVLDVDYYFTGIKDIFRRIFRRKKKIA